MAATLAELAVKFDCELHGAGELVVDRVATLANAGPGTISFFANPLYREQLLETAAEAVILEAKYVDACPVVSLVAANPYATYARVADFLHPVAVAAPGVHPDASLAAGTKVPSSVHIGAQAVIGAGVELGEQVEIGAGTVLGRNVEIGPHTRLAPRVTVLDGVRIGARCRIHSGVVIGSDGFGFAADGDAWVKVPQLGSVVIGDDVEIGANTTVDRGTIEDTVIEDGVKLDNLVQIAHNVRVGAHTVMAAMSGAAGSTKIGRRCKIGGGVVMINQIQICDDAMFTFRSVVTKSVTRPGIYGGSLAADDMPRWRRNAARFRRLDGLAERLRTLEKALRRLTTENKAKGHD